MNRLLSCVVALGLLFAATASFAADAPEKASANKKLRVLVVAGGHGYEVKPFRAIFDNYKDCECTFVDEKDGGEALDDILDKNYDAVVFYNYQCQTTEKQQANLLKLLDRGIGVVVLHHGIYAYLPWQEWRRIAGFTKGLNTYEDDVDYTIHVEDAKHPITQGVRDFAIQDETYKNYEIDPKMHVILTTDEPTNAKTIAWTHTYRNSPVCYLQSGHGPAAFGNKNFVTLLGNAIRWGATEAKKKP